MASKARPPVWIGWARDLWCEPPWTWISDKNSARYNAFECMQALLAAYPDHDGDGNKRFSLVVLPMSEIPEDKRKHA